MSLMEVKANNIKKPFQYQKNTANFLAKKRSALLAVEMGLGKTASVLYFLNWLQPKTVLIVAPKRVARDVWVQETMDNWQPTLSGLTDKMQIISGSKKVRYEQLLNDKPYKVVSRDNLKDLFELGLTSFEVLVIDELTSFKNPTSNRTMLINQIKAERKIGLTGTPTANSLIDIFSQVAVLDMEKMNVIERGKFKFSPEFNSWRASNFRDVLKGAGLQFSKWMPVRPMEQILKPYINNIFTLKAEDYLDIPEVSYKYHQIVLPKEEIDEYKSMETFLIAEVGGDMVAVDEGARFAKLQTLCNGFVYVKNEATGEIKTVRRKTSEKLNQVSDFILQAVAENEQVLVFYAFTAERDWLIELLKKGDKGIRIGNADDTEKWDKKEIDVMITHPASAGHGLNLQKSGARLIVWSSITYNFEFWKQANARLARQGQKRGVQIHVFGTVNTCESRKYNAVLLKDGVNEEFLNLTK